MKDIDTIAAIATPAGYGGISIIRLSGADSLKIASNIFTNKEKLEKNPRMMVYGNIIDKEETIDEVLSSYHKAPYSYTKEDVVEIHCHGGYESSKRILSLLLQHGARLAQKGEFTKRAFLNGRLDLTQAQAVIDTINATNINAHKIAQSHLKGKLSKKIDEIYDIITMSLAKITSAIDFPDEDNPEVTTRELLEDIKNSILKIDELLKTYTDGKAIKDGINIAIIGRPNVGKSSLLNTLLQEERAIVTDIAGTTRDVIKEQLIINSLPLNIIDTAGIRDTTDTIEQIGVTKSLSHMEEADLILLLIDGSNDLTSEDIELLEKTTEKDVIIILTKSDITQKINEDNLKKYNSKEIIHISSKTGEKISELKEKIYSHTITKDLDPNEQVIITSENHKNYLLNTKKSLNDAKVSIEDNMALDIVEIDFYNAIDEIGLITGKTASEEILNTMFEKFCIGK